LVPVEPKALPKQEYEVMQEDEEYVKLVPDDVMKHPYVYWVSKKDLAKLLDVERS